MTRTADPLQRLQLSLEAGVHYLKSHYDPNVDLSRIVVDYLSHIVQPHTDVSLGSLVDNVQSRHIPSFSTGFSDLMTHYTSVPNLVSMLTKTEDENPSLFRLYDSAHLNDPVEGQLFVNQFKQHYSWFCHDTHSLAYIASFIDSDSIKGNDVSDDLVFWRTYGLDGQGCSIEVYLPAHRLRRVLYGPEEVESTLQELSPVLSLLNDFYLQCLEIPAPATLSNAITQTLSEMVWPTLSHLQYLYKHQAFDFEREYRIVRLRSEVPPDDIRIDCRNDVCVGPIVRHYCDDRELAIKKLFSSGSRVVIGPSVPYREDLLNTLNLLRDRAKLRGLGIKHSLIDYRRH